MPPKEQQPPLQIARDYMQTLRDFRSVYTPPDYAVFIQAEKTTEAYRRNSAVLIADLLAQRTAKALRREQRVGTAGTSLTDSAISTEFAVPSSTITPGILRQQIDERVKNDQQSADATWATSQMQEYARAIAVPKEGERKKEVAFAVASAAMTLFRSPDRFATAISVWRSHTAIEGEITATPFHALVTKEVATLYKEKFSQVKAQQIAELIKTVTYSPLAESAAREALQGYISGPEHKAKKARKRTHGPETWDAKMDQWEDVANTLYLLAETALDLADDYPTLQTVTAIHNADDAAIVPMGSHFMLVKYYIGNYCIDGTARQDRILKKNGIAAGIFNAFTMIADIPEVSQGSVAAVLETMPSVQREKELLDKHLTSKLGPDQAQARKKMVRFGTGQNVYYEGGETQLPWFNTLLEDPNDPLFRRYSNELGAEITFHHMREDYIRSTFGATVDRKQIAMVTIPVEQDQGLMHMLVPKSLLPKIQAVMRTASDKYTSEVQEGHLLTSDSARSNRFLQWDLQVDGQNFHVWARPATEREKRLHPVNRLRETGFPVVNMDQARELSQMNSNLAREVYVTRQRFINPSGYRVRLDKTPFGRLHYSSIDFFKDPRHPSQTTARFNHDTGSVAVKLHADFTLDGEGRSFPDPAFRESLHFTILSLLQPILCSPAEEREETEPSTETRTVLSRGGFYRYLPKDWHYSPEAVGNCLLQQEEDLEIRSMIRQDDAQKNAAMEYAIAQTFKGIDEGKYSAAMRKAALWTYRSECLSTYVSEITSNETIPPVDKTGKIPPDALELLTH